MPAAVPLSAREGQVEQYLSAMRMLGRKTGRSTTQAAHTFARKVDRAGGWDQLAMVEQADAIGKARSCPRTTSRVGRGTT